MKLKTALAALSCAVAMACAGQASAAERLLTISGNWDADPPFSYSRWSISVRYDTTTIVSAPWTDSSGAAGQQVSFQPISQNGILYGYQYGNVDNGPFPNGSFEIIPTIYMSPNAIEIQTDQGQIGTSYLGANFRPVALDQAGSYPTFMYDYLGPGYFAGEYEWTFGLSIIGVPEPATWAMMALGALAVGGALRIRRKASLSRVAA